MGREAEANGIQACGALDRASLEATRSKPLLPPDVCSLGSRLLTAIGKCCDCLGEFVEHPGVFFKQVSKTTSSSAVSGGAQKLHPRGRAQESSGEGRKLTALRFCVSTALSARLPLIRGCGPSVWKRSAPRRRSSLFLRFASRGSAAVKGGFANRCQIESKFQATRMFRRPCVWKRIIFGRSCLSTTQRPSSSYSK